MSGESNFTATAESVRAHILEHQEKSRRAYLKAAGLLFLALAAGILIGAGGAVMYLRSTAHRPPPRPDEIGRFINTTLGEVVALNPEERESVKSIIDRHMDEVEKIRRDGFRSMRRQLDEMNKELDTELGEDRATQWHNYKRERFGDRMRKHHGRQRNRSRDPSPLDQSGPEPEEEDPIGAVDGENE